MTYLVAFEDWTHEQELLRRSVEDGSLYAYQVEKVDAGMQVTVVIANC